MIISSAKTVSDYILNLSDFSWHTCPFPYGHMGASIVDASLQAGLNYENVVRKRVMGFRNTHPECIKTSDFNNLIGKIELSELINWKHEEKLNRIRAVLTLLLQENIETERDLYEWIVSESNCEKLLGIRVIGPKTLDYYRLISGHSTIAIDRHLFAFIRDADVPVGTYQDAHAILKQTASILMKDAKDLDHSIWRYMSEKSRKRR